MADRLRRKGAGRSQPGPRLGAGKAKSSGKKQDEAAGAKKKDEATGAKKKRAKRGRSGL